MRKRQHDASGGIADRRRPLTFGLVFNHRGQRQDQADTRIREPLAAVPRWRYRLQRSIANPNCFPTVVYPSTLLSDVFQDVSKVTATT